MIDEGSLQSTVDHEIGHIIGIILLGGSRPYRPNNAANCRRRSSCRIQGLMNDQSKFVPLEDSAVRALQVDTEMKNIDLEFMTGYSDGNRDIYSNLIASTGPGMRNMARPAYQMEGRESSCFGRHDNPPTLNLASISQTNFIEMNYDNGAIINF